MNTYTWEEAVEIIERQIRSSIEEDLPHFPDYLKSLIEHHKEAKEMSTDELVELAHEIGTHEGASNPYC